MPDSKGSGGAMKQTKAALSGGQRFHRKSTARLGYDIADIHARVGDLADWIGNRYGVLVSTHRGKTTHIECPKHQPGHTTSAYVTHWPDGQTFRCERCVIGPVDVIDLVVVLGEVNDRGAAIRMLGESLGAETGTHTPFVGKQPRAPKPPAKRSPVADNDPRPDAAVAERIKSEYLALRCWSSATWERHRLEVVLRHRRPAIRHPFRIQGETWSWQDRMLSGDKKWMNAKGALALPFNIDAVTPEFAFVHVTEGPPDAITLTEALFPTYPAIAAPGSGSWRKEWGHEAARKPLVIVSPDNDAAGAGFVADVIESVKGSGAFIGVVMPPTRHKDLTDWWTAEGEDAAEGILRQLEFIDAHRLTQHSTGAIGAAMPQEQIDAGVSQ